MTSPVELARYTRWRVEKARRRRLDPTKRWRLELRREVGFWGRVIDSGGDYPQAWNRRFDPQVEVVDRLITDRLDHVASDPIKILDVGAGPASVVGVSYPGKRLEVTATDPLADEYEQMLDAAGLEPPVRTMLCRGEDLLEHFGPNRFDFVYARNSVDHSVDPLTIIRNMVGVAKPGGFVLLRHYQNEGVSQDYEGLHQWNFDLRDDRLVLWNPWVSHDLETTLGDQVEISAEIQPWTDSAPWIAVALRKRAD